MSGLYVIYNIYNELGMEVPDELIEALADEAREIEWEKCAEAMLNLPF